MTWMFIATFYYISLNIKRTEFKNDEGLEKNVQFSWIHKLHKFIFTTLRSGLRFLNIFQYFIKSIVVLFERQT